MFEPALALNRKLKGSGIRRKENMMRNNKILAISLILAAFLIAVFSPLPVALVNQDEAAPAISLAANIDPRTIAPCTHVGLNLTGGSYAKNAMLVNTGGSPFSMSVPQLHVYLPVTQYE